MKGTVLSYDGTDGTILGGDGARYRFTADGWSGDQAPRAHQEIDFVARDGTAIDIFPLRAAASGAKLAEAVKTRMQAAEQALGEQEAGDIVGKVRILLAERPQMIASIVLVLASIMLTWLTMGSGLQPQRVDASLVSLPGIIGDMRAPLEDSVTAMSNYLTQAQGSPYTAPGMLATARSNLNRASTALWLLRFAPILYLIPLGAAAALFFEYRNRRSRLLELGTGVLAVLALLAVMYGREMVAEAVTNNFGAGGATVRSLIKIGLGGWVTALCGIALVLTALGVVRRTPGL